MKTGRKVTCMQICLCFDTGDAVRVLAPADHKPVGIRKQLGWRVALLGMWIMFGHSRDFKSVVLPYPTNQCQGGISHDNVG